MTALREALAEEALQRLSDIHQEMEAEQEPPAKKFHILAVTTAYEQGVGKGHQAFKRGNDIENPYVEQSECAEAWRLGYEEGKLQAKNSFSYVHPAPQPTKQPLTEAQIEAAVASVSVYQGEYAHAIAQAIEKAHGII